MAADDFCGALECPQETFDGLTAQLTEDGELLAGDYMQGLVRPDDVWLHFDRIQRYVYDALGTRFLLNGGDASRPRHRCGSSEAFGSLLADYAAWREGAPMAEHPNPEWLSVLVGYQDGKPVLAPATPEKKARLFRLCGLCALSVRNFAHDAFEGERPRFIRRNYGTGALYHINEDFTEDGGFLHDSDPVGKTYRIRSEQGTEGEVTVTGETGALHLGGADIRYYRATGWIAAYADTDKDQACKLMLSGHGADNLKVYFFRYAAKAAMSQGFPLETHEKWRPYYEAMAEFKRWVDEDEKVLFSERLRELGFGDDATHVAYCVYG